MKPRKQWDDSAEAVLETLLELGRVTSHTLIARHGPAAKSRIGSVRDRGYNIRTTYGEAGATYTLLSRTPVPGDGESRKAEYGCRVVVRLDGELEVRPYKDCTDRKRSQELVDALQAEAERFAAKYAKEPEEINVFDFLDGVE